MQVSVGQRLASTVCAAEVIVIRADGDDVDLTCGGAAVTTVGADDAHAGSSAADGEGTQIGKRYVDAGGRVELLCTKAGTGALALAGEPLTIKAAKALPSSD